MDALNDQRLQGLFEQDASLLEMLDHLSMREDVPLTGMRFLWIFQMELGISFVESRKILDCFDPAMRPKIDAAEINQRWRAIMRGFLDRSPHR
ncbi:hypothetical protein [Nocardia sp. NBC_01327]|uniref:hypothetical protein n=1 Tax=Nocardia sp. NBC_01327 TaxID=2903593 RepID=UPI002E15CB63|nr:hypothetical protein OG326_42120 [Nocardia sp. NBC_01327]